MNQRCRRSSPGFLFAVLFLVPAISLALLSCRPRQDAASAPEAPSPARRIQIGFSLDSLVVERWLRDRDVFVSTANELGADVIFQNAANDPGAQVSQVKYLIDRAVDVLVIIPQDADLLVEQVQRAKSKGIKVISYDRLIRNAGVDLYVSVNSVEVGRLMAAAIIRRAPAGNYVIINGPKTDNNVSLVREGLQSVFVDYPGVYPLRDYYAKNWSYDLAFDEVSRLLEEGQRIDGIVCGNDGLAGGAIRALAERGLAGKIPVVGQDADIAACQYVVEGLQLATVYKPITQLARKAAAFAVAMARGDYAPPATTIRDGTADVPVCWLSPTLVTAANMDEVVIKSGFHTADEIYRNLPPEKRPASVK